MIDRDELHRLVAYDPDTGLFTARVERANGKIRAGSVLGTSGAGGEYIALTINGVRYLAHNLAWFYAHGEWVTCDHKNCRGRDNRLENLRPATRSQNGANVRLQRNNTSGFKGVDFNKRAGRWRANIKVDGRAIYLGLFDTPEAAHGAYIAAAEAAFGEFARAA